MLHTRTHKSRMAIMIKQLMPECGTGVNRGNGRENIRHNWTGEYHKSKQEKC